MSPTPRTLLVTGDREWSDEKSVYEVLYEYHTQGFARIVNGKCRGLDLLARHIAVNVLGGWEPLDYPYIRELGRAGGPVRNQQMLDQHPEIEVCLAFHNNLLESRGTADMIRRAQSADVRVRHFTSEGERLECLHGVPWSALCRSCRRVGS